MADVLVSTVVRTILGNLTSLALRKLKIASNLKSELENLEGTLSTIQAVLQDAEQKQWRSEAVKNWLRKLKEVAYDADDILDEFAAEALKWRARRNMSSQVSDFFSSQNSTVFNFKKAHKLKLVRQRLDAVAEEKKKFHLTEKVGDVEIDDSEWRQTSSLVNESEIFGRHGDRENIINVLLNLKDQNDLSIYSICGMGGLGKTTLAQLVYNDERVERAFDLRIWVCVSDDFEVRRLTKAIIESIDGSPSNNKELDTLQRQLQEKLRGKRFLIILDDVWSENNEKWNSLKKPLGCGAKGSVVIVTTRIENIALIMATLPMHRLGYLSEDDSWLLFKQHAFVMKREEDNPRCTTLPALRGFEESHLSYIKLERIGKQIVKKCGGVPLAVKALGSMLRLKHRESDWLSVKESEIWELSDNGSSILPALRLSYDDLPSHLRQCFAYCSIFPKDNEMDKSQLIELWIANGFVPPRGQRELHTIGDEIFLKLSRRSFFQDVTEHDDGTVTCKMHDLIHDLAMSIMGYECYMFDYSKFLEFPEKILHLHPEKIRYLHIPMSPIPPPHLEKILTTKEVDLVKSCSSSRSLILGGLVFSADFSSLKHLRALDCHMIEVPKSLGKMIHLRYLNIGHRFCNIKRIPKSIGNLVHLTYLNLSWSLIKRLPQSTTCLQNLQIMKLSWCCHLRELPNGMKDMRNLRRVDISHCNSLMRTPPEIGYLAQLVELSIFIVRKDHGCGISELNELDLEKELCLKELDNVTGSTEAKSANLIRKQNLRSLSLIWGKGAGKFPDNEEEVLNSLQPHFNLKYLKICGFQGLRLPGWMIGVSKLVSVELVQCRRCSCLPPLGELPLLKFLKISGMDAVECISSEFYGNGVNSFPSLEELNFDLMPNLETWETVKGRENIPRLQSLIFRKCPKLNELPKFPTLKKFRILKSNDGFFPQPGYPGSLVIDDLSSLTIVPNGLLQNHTHLEELMINFLPNIESLSNQLDNLSLLKHLHLSCCNKLEDIPEALQNLKSLESLILDWCDSLVSFPVNGLHGLTSLRILKIRCCEKFTSLSDGVMHLTQLEKLCLVCCPMLNSLPEEIQRLTSLSKLKIVCCSNIMSLPQGLQGLSALKALKIVGCPDLRRRCNKDGEDWPNIAHIPSVKLLLSNEECFGQQRSHGNLLTRFGDWTNKFLQCEPHSS